MTHCYKLLAFVLFISLSPIALSQDFKAINIEISSENKSLLDASPFSNNDVIGHFTADSVRYDSIDLHYRGAWYLQELINSGSRRNWKVKFPKDNMYEGHREWNFNYENYIRQMLAYYIFREANIPVVSTENVILSVNGTRQGLYLKYEDPDNKTWLKNTFGDNDGDLYKAAYDIPYQTVYFADLTYLGDSDSDYYNHYRKQTNISGDEALDYSSIRKFISAINHTSDEEFERVILEKFDVEEFIKYLVIANFTSAWDNYPYRPKNYFLYHNPDDSKWHFIPWDIDGTFQEDERSDRNSIGTDGSIFYYFDGIGSYNYTSGEPLDRPLLWRIMEIQSFRDKYCYEYQKALDSYLDTNHLYQIINNYESAVLANTSGYELYYYQNDVDDVKDFIALRNSYVSNELSSYQVDANPFTLSEDYSKLMPTEINYHPLDSISATDTIGAKKFEFIEFKNTSETEAIDLSGLFLGVGVDFQFPYDFMLEPQDYFVIAADSTHFENRYAQQASGIFDGSLSNSGEQLTLFNQYNQPILGFSYSDVAPWPAEADGQGYTLSSVFENPTGNPSEASYWLNGQILHGSPFATDSDYMNNSRVIDSTKELALFYPNPSSDILFINAPKGETTQCLIEVFNLKGHLILNQTFNISTTLSLKDYPIPYSLYVIKLTTASKTKFEKVIYTP